MPAHEPPDMTMTDEFLTPNDMLEAFAAAAQNLPRAALRQATLRWNEAGPVFLAKLQAVADGEYLSASVTDMSFYVIFLMAQQREHRAFAPLCALGMEGEPLHMILGDATTEYLSVLLARMFDGKAKTLVDLMACSEADEFVRDAAFDAFAWLAATGRIDRDFAADTLRDQFDTLKTTPRHVAWLSWINAVLLLRLEQLAPLAEQAFSSGLIDPEIEDFEHFQNDLRSMHDPAKLAAALEVFEQKIKALDDVASLMATWDCFAPRKPRRRFARPPAPSEAVRNPLRHVGRNDACPCGSGNKYKKCCLAN